MDALYMGLLVSLTHRCWIPYTTRDLDCLGAFRTSPVENLYVDAHEPSLGARCAKLSLQYATKIKSLPNHPAHNAVFDNTYMKLFDARPSAIRTLTFVSSSYQPLPTLIFLTFWKHLHIFHFTTLVYQTTEYCAGFGASEKKIEQTHQYTSNVS